MGEPVNVLRMTISVPKAVKARMDAAEAVNWSAVATAGFEAKLLELSGKKTEVNGMDEVKARLRAAAELETNEDYQAGFEAGAAWAKTQATPKQLRRLTEYVDSPDNTSVAWWDVDYPHWNAPFGAADYFVFAIWPHRDKDDDAPGEFWEAALGDAADRIEDADYLHGFGEGAADLWQKVANDL